MTVQHPDTDHTRLDLAIEASLDSLLTALTLEPLGDDRFRATSERSRFDRLFGGQQLGQAVVAASATVEGKDPHSLHAYFVEGGTPEEPDRPDGRTGARRALHVDPAGHALAGAAHAAHRDRLVPRQPGVARDAEQPPRRAARPTNCRACRSGCTRCPTIAAGSA